MRKSRYLFTLGLVMGLFIGIVLGWITFPLIFIQVMTSSVILN